MPAVSSGSHFPFSLRPSGGHVKWPVGRLCLRSDGSRPKRQKSLKEDRRATSERASERASAWAKFVRSVHSSSSRLFSSSPPWLRPGGLHLLYMAHTIDQSVSIDRSIDRSAGLRRDFVLLIRHHAVSAPGPSWMHLNLNMKIKLFLLLPARSPIFGACGKKRGRSRDDQRGEKMREMDKGGGR